ncbi:MAG: hypothetical protein ACOCQ4_01720 [bacterium]
MNLVKIEKSLSRYIEEVKKNEIPDVKKLYDIFGRKLLGRKIYSKPRKDKIYFNKSKEHKKYKSYIGHPHPDFYAQEIIEPRLEKRLICVRGEVNCRFWQETVDVLVEELNIKDFVIDVWENKKNQFKIMELNEIHLSSLTKEELNFVYKMIL